MKSFACNVKVNAIEYFHIKLNTNEEIKVMKQKLRNLSAPANIIFAILAVFIFIAPLQWSGKVLGLIPGMEKADDYLLQAIVDQKFIHRWIFYSILSVCCCFRYLYVLFG